LYQNM